MKITEKENYPVQYEDILVFPEYFIDFTSNIFNRDLRKYKNDDINYYVVGVGNTYGKNRTSVLLINSSGQIVGVREKISIFLGEGSDPSLRLEAFNIIKNRKLGIVICKEVLHTAIAEVYRMMGVNMLAVTIGGGDFWDLQRQSWIDQMSLFSDITNSPLVCSCGATKTEGGINLIIER
jgi:predicted amidohydrolase